MRSAAVALAALAVFLPAAGHAGPAPAVRIVAFGDFGVGGSAQKAFGDGVRAFAAKNPVDALVLLGDNDYTESPGAFRANWQMSFGWAKARGLRVAAVLGNHDVRVDRGRYEFGTFAMPGRYYRRRIGDVELFLLDSNLVDARQTAWLQRSLAASRARWKVAVFHHPAFTCGSYRSHPDVVRRWTPLFESYRVKLALSGHDHNYQRFAPRRGVRYVVHGGANPNLYEVDACPAGYPRRMRAQVEHGFLYLVARGDRLDGWAVWPDGRRRDHFVLRS
ncbi:MAG: metallophosphoesterase family protein [Gaiellaceae bacterium]